MMTIERIAQAASPNEVGLTSSRVFPLLRGPVIQAILNSLAYGLNKQVRNEWNMLCNGKRVDNTAGQDSSEASRFSAEMSETKRLSFPPVRSGESQPSSTTKRSPLHEAEDETGTELTITTMGKGKESA